MPAPSGKNKTNKTHRNKKKNTKRLTELAAYTKAKKVPKSKTNKQGGSGTVYNPVKKRLDQMAKGNSVVSLVKGISDTVKLVKNKT